MGKMVRLLKAEGIDNVLGELIGAEACVRGQGRHYKVKGGI